jgi:RNA polymerase sigma factor (sigma-70 family)
MAAIMSSPKPGSSDAAGFAATRWTLVLAAARGSPTPRAAEAMGELCRAYWYPLYAYVRRRGHDAHEAEDLTQEFFLRLLAKDFLAGVDPHKGKFRAFLLAAIKHFLSNEWDRAKAQKRGGGRRMLSLDALEGKRDGKRGQAPFLQSTLRGKGACPLFPNAESRYGLELSHNLTPERLFERQWALTVLEQVLARLHIEYLAWHGDQATFDALKPFLAAGRQPGGYAALAAALGTTEGAVKVAVHRLRRRYRQLLRDEIAHTVATPEEIDDEIRYLLACL